MCFQVVKGVFLSVFHRRVRRHFFRGQRRFVHATSRAFHRATSGLPRRVVNNARTGVTKRGGRLRVFRGIVIGFYVASGGHFSVFSRAFFNLF